MKILVVCLGNICRSPLAEGLLQREIEQRGLDWEVDSAGTGAWHVGEAPDRRSVVVARTHGLDITHQRARQIRPADLAEYDLILAMDESNKRNILALARSEEERAKVHTILDFTGIRPEDPNVPDPYYNDGFPDVYRLLEAATAKTVEKILAAD